MKISIITAVYDNVTHISEALDSVLSQDYPNIEYIIIDGGSTDGTIGVIEEYRDRLSVILSEPDHGIYDALNKGVRLATGDVVGFLHSDDIYAGHRVISKIAKKFESETVDVVYSDLDYVKSDDTNRVIRHWSSGRFSVQKLRRGWMPPHPTVYARREVYLRTGIFDLNYRISADYDYLLRMLTNRTLRVCYIPQVLIKMRLGGISNQSLSNIIKKSLEDYRIVKNNQVGGMLSIIWKNFSKIPQFLISEGSIPRRLRRIET